MIHSVGPYSTEQQILWPLHTEVCPRPTCREGLGAKLRSMKKAEGWESLGFLKDLFGVSGSLVVPHGSQAGTKHKASTAPRQTPVRFVLTKVVAVYIHAEPLGLHDPASRPFKDECPWDFESSIIYEYYI